MHDYLFTNRLGEWVFNWFWRPLDKTDAIHDVPVISKGWPVWAYQPPISGPRSTVPDVLYMVPAVLKPADQRPQCVICCGAAHCDKLDLDNIGHGPSQWSLVHINHSWICQRPISLQVRPREREKEREAVRGPKLNFKALNCPCQKGVRPWLE